MRRFFVGVGAAVAFALPLIGCSSSPMGSLLGGEEATALAPIKLDLPPPPSFADDEQAVEYPDGSMSVYGLRKQKNKYLSQEVTVKAYLLEVYHCRRCPKGQECRLCDQPHFFLSDKPNGRKEKALMVTDYVARRRPPPALTIGKQYNVTGAFLRTTPTGFTDSDGLLQFIKTMNDSGKEYLSEAARLEAKAVKDEKAQQ